MKPSKISTIKKYIGYFTLSTVFILSVPNLFAGTFKKVMTAIETPEAKKIPFERDKGYISGGKAFKHSIKDKSEKTFSIEDFKGNVVLVALYATWCPSCPQVIKSLDNLANEFKKQGINNVKILVLNVGEDSIDTLEAYYKSRDINSLDVYQSVSSDVMEGIQGVPVCLVFDKKSAPVWGYLGTQNYEALEFIEFIKKLAEQEES